jgi:hypothetical protein
MAGWRISRGCVRVVLSEPIEMVSAGQEVVLRVEVERHEMLLLRAAQLAHLRMDLLGRRDRGASREAAFSTRRESSKRRGQPAGPRIPHTGIRHPLLDGERGHRADARSGG